MVRKLKSSATIAVTYKFAFIEDNTQYRRYEFSEDKIRKEGQMYRITDCPQLQYIVNNQNPRVKISQGYFLSSILHYRSHCCEANQVYDNGSCVDITTCEHDQMKSMALEIAYVLYI